jgi:hypothetical protein
MANRIDEEVTVEDDACTHVQSQPDGLDGDASTSAM